MKFVFIGDKKSEYIKHIKYFFAHIESIIIDTEPIFKYSQQKNVCFVTPLSSIGAMNSDTDLLYQAMFNGVDKHMKKKIIDINIYLLKHKIKPEIVGNTSYLPVGSSILVPIPGDNCFLLGAPTKSYQKDIINNSKNYYYFFKSVIKLINNYNRSFSSTKIDTIVVPDVTQKNDDVREMFNGYFDMFFGMDNDQPSFNTSTVYYFSAPMKSNFSILEKK